LANFGSFRRFWREKNPSWHIQDGRRLVLPQGFVATDTRDNLYFSYRIVKFPFHAKAFCEKRRNEKVDGKKQTIIK